MLADFIFDTVPSDTLAFYSEFNAALVRDAFSSSANYFTDEELLRSFHEYDGRIALESIYGYLTFGDDKDKMLSDIKTALSLVREKYF